MKKTPDKIYGFGKGIITSEKAPYTNASIDKYAIIIFKFLVTGITSAVYKRVLDIIEFYDNRGLDWVDSGLDPSDYAIKKFKEQKKK